MSDDSCDIASALEDQHREAALALHHATNPRAASPADGCCTACGEVIPPRRLAIPGVTRCIDCQTGFEASQRHYRRREI